MKKLIKLFLVTISIIIVSCNKDKELEIYPIRFNQPDYTVMMYNSNTISYVDGGGVYEIGIGNPSVIDQAYIDTETQRLFVIPKTPGSSTITIKDKKADATVTLNITVIDFYLSFIVNDITGRNINPYIEKNCQIRFIRTMDNAKKIEIFTRDNSYNEYERLAEGYFDMIKGENEFTLELSLHEGQQYELMLFSYSVKGDNHLFDIFNMYFDYNWGKSIESRTLPYQQVKMDLFDTQFDCTIYTVLRPFNPNID